MGEKGREARKEENEMQERGTNIQDNEKRLKKKKLKDRKNKVSQP